MGKKNKHNSPLNICPYCKTRKTGSERFCFACNLDFSELEKSNVSDVKEFRKTKKAFESEEGIVVESPLVPDDINYSTLKMMTFFLGFFGIHNFYAGKTAKGVLMLINGVFAISMFLLYSYMFSNKNELMSFFVAYFILISLFYYIYDILQVIRRKFKFPTKLKTPINVAQILEAGKK